MENEMNRALKNTSSNKRHGFTESTHRRRSSRIHNLLNVESQETESPIELPCTSSPIVEFNKSYEDLFDIYPCAIQSPNIKNAKESPRERRYFKRNIELKSKSASCESKQNEIHTEAGSEVLNIIPQPSNLETSPVKNVNRSSLKTYTNPRKSTGTSNVIESFGLPDMPSGFTNCISNPASLDEVLDAEILDAKEITIQALEFIDTPWCIIDLEESFIDFNEIRVKAEPDVICHIVKPTEINNQLQTLCNDSDLLQESPHTIGKKVVSNKCFNTRKTKSEVIFANHSLSLDENEVEIFNSSMPDALSESTNVQTNKLSHKQDHKTSSLDKQLQIKNDVSTNKETKTPTPIKSDYSTLEKNDMDSVVAGQTSLSKPDVPKRILRSSSCTDLADGKLLCDTNKFKRPSEFKKSYSQTNLLSSKSNNTQRNVTNTKFAKTNSESSLDIKSKVTTSGTNIDQFNPKSRANATRQLKIVLNNFVPCGNKSKASQSSLLQNEDIFKEKGKRATDMTSSNPQLLVSIDKANTLPSTCAIFLELVDILSEGKDNIPKDLQTPSKLNVTKSNDHKLVVNKQQISKLNDSTLNVSLKRENILNKDSQKNKSVEIKDISGSSTESSSPEIIPTHKFYGKEEKIRHPKSPKGKMSKEEAEMFELKKLIAKLNASEGRKCKIAANVKLSECIRHYSRRPQSFNSPSDNLLGNTSATFSNNAFDQELQNGKIMDSHPITPLEKIPVSTNLYFSPNQSITLSSSPNKSQENVKTLETIHPLGSNVVNTEITQKSSNPDTNLLPILNMNVKNKPNCKLTESLCDGSPQLSREIDKCKTDASHLFTDNFCLTDNEPIINNTYNKLNIEKQNCTNKRSNSKVLDKKQKNFESLDSPVTSSSTSSSKIHPIPPPVISIANNDSKLCELSMKKVEQESMSITDTPIRQNVTDNYKKRKTGISQRITMATDKTVGVIFQKKTRSKTLNNCIQETVPPKLIDNTSIPYQNIDDTHDHIESSNSSPLKIIQHKYDHLGSTESLNTDVVSSPRITRSKVSRERRLFEGIIEYISSHSTNSPIVASREDRDVNDKTFQQKTRRKTSLGENTSESSIKDSVSPKLIENNTNFQHKMFDRNIESKNCPSTKVIQNKLRVSESNFLINSESDKDSFPRITRSKSNIERRKFEGNNQGIANHVLCSPKMTRATLGGKAYSGETKDDISICRKSTVVNDLNLNDTFPKITRSKTSLGEPITKSFIKDSVTAKLIANNSPVSQAKLNLSDCNLPVTESDTGVSPRITRSKSNMERGMFKAKNENTSYTKSSPLMTSLGQRSYDGDIENETNISLRTTIVANDMNLDDTFQRKTRSKSSLKEMILGNSITESMSLKLLEDNSNLKLKNPECSDSFSSQVNQDGITLSDCNRGSSDIARRKSTMERSFEGNNEEALGSSKITATSLGRRTYSEDINHRTTIVNDLNADDSFQIKTRSKSSLGEKILKNSIKESILYKLFENNTNINHKSFNDAHENKECNNSSSSEVNQDGVSLSDGNTITENLNTDKDTSTCIRSRRSRSIMEREMFEGTKEDTICSPKITDNLSEWTHENETSMCHRSSAANDMNSEHNFQRRTRSKSSLGEKILENSIKESVSLKNNTTIRHKIIDDTLENIECSDSSSSQVNQDGITLSDCNTVTESLNTDEVSFSRITRSKSAMDRSFEGNNEHTMFSPRKARANLGEKRYGEDSEEETSPNLMSSAVLEGCTEGGIWNKTTSSGKIFSKNVVNQSTPKVTRHRLNSGDIFVKDKKFASPKLTELTSIDGKISKEISNEITTPKSRRLSRKKASNDDNINLGLDVCDQETKVESLQEIQPKNRDNVAVTKQMSISQNHELVSTKLTRSVGETINKNEIINTNDHQKESYESSKKVNTATQLVKDKNNLDHNKITSANGTGENNDIIVVNNLHKIDSTSDMLETASVYPNCQRDQVAKHQIDSVDNIANSHVIAGNENECTDISHNTKNRIEKSVSQTGIEINTEENISLHGLKDEIIASCSSNKENIQSIDQEETDQISFNESMTNVSDEALISTSARDNNSEKENISGEKIEPVIVVKEGDEAKRGRSKRRQSRKEKSRSVVATDGGNISLNDNKDKTLELSNCSSNAMNIQTIDQREIDQISFNESMTNVSEEAIISTSNNTSGEKLDSVEENEAKRARSKRRQTRMKKSRNVVDTDGRNISLNSNKVENLQLSNCSSNTKNIEGMDKEQTDHISFDENMTNVSDKALLSTSETEEKLEFVIKEGTEAKRGISKRRQSRIEKSRSVVDTDEGNISLNSIKDETLQHSNSCSNTMTIQTIDQGQIDQICIDQSMTNVSEGAIISTSDKKSETENTSGENLEAVEENEAKRARSKRRQSRTEKSRNVVDTDGRNFSLNSNKDEHLQLSNCSSNTKNIEGIDQEQISFDESMTNVSDKALISTSERDNNSEEKLEFVIKEGTEAKRGISNRRQSRIEKSRSVVDTDEGNISLNSIKDETLQHSNSCSNTMTIQTIDQGQIEQICIDQSMTNVSEGAIISTSDKKSEIENTSGENLEAVEENEAKRARSKRRQSRTEKSRNVVNTDERNISLNSNKDEHLQLSNCSSNTKNIEGIDQEQISFDESMTNVSDKALISTSERDNNSEEKLEFVIKEGTEAKRGISKRRQSRIGKSRSVVDTDEANISLNSIKDETLQHSNSCSNTMTIQTIDQGQIDQICVDQSITNVSGGARISTSDKKSENENTSGEKLEYVEENEAKRTRSKRRQSRMEESTNVVDTYGGNISLNSNKDETLQLSNSSNTKNIIGIDQEQTDQTSFDDSMTNVSEEAIISTSDKKSENQNTSKEILEPIKEGNQAKRGRSNKRLSRMEKFKSVVDTDAGILSLNSNKDETLDLFSCSSNTMNIHTINQEETAQISLGESMTNVSEEAIIPTADNNSENENTSGEKLEPVKENEAKRANSKKRQSGMEKSRIVVDRDEGNVLLNSNNDEILQLSSCNSNAMKVRTIDQEQIDQNSFDKSMPNVSDKALISTSERDNNSEKESIKNIQIFDQDQKNQTSLDESKPNVSNEVSITTSATPDNSLKENSFGEKLEPPVKRENVVRRGRPRNQRGSRSLERNPMRQSANIEAEEMSTKGFSRSKSVGPPQQILKHRGIRNNLEFKRGDIVWAQIGNYPYWPCVITNEPNTKIFNKVIFRRMVPRIFYHVRFFGDKGRRAWIHTTKIMEYTGKDDLQNLYDTLKEATTAANLQVYHVKQQMINKWTSAVDEVEFARSQNFNLKQLIEFLETSRIRHTNPESQGRHPKEITPKSLKKESTNNDESLVDIKPETLEYSEDENSADTSIKKKIKLTSPSGPQREKFSKKLSNESEVTITDEVSDFQQIQPSCSKMGTAPTQQSETEEEISIKDNYSDTEYKISAQCFKHFGSYSLEEQKILFKTNNLFKGVPKDKVCQFCFNFGDILKCKGGCNGIYHPHCATQILAEKVPKRRRVITSSIKTEPNNESVEVKQVEKQEPSTSGTQSDIDESHVQIITVPSSVCNTPPRKTFPPNFMNMSLVERIDYKMKEIMKKFESPSYLQMLRESSSDEKPSPSVKHKSFSRCQDLFPEKNRSSLQDSSVLENEVEGISIKEESSPFTPKLEESLETEKNATSGCLDDSISSNNSEVITVKEEGDANNVVGHVTADTEQDNLIIGPVKKRSLNKLRSSNQYRKSMKQHVTADSPSPICRPNHIKPRLLQRDTSTFRLNGARRSLKKHVTADSDSVETMDSESLRSNSSRQSKQSEMSEDVYKSVNPKNFICGFCTENIDPYCFICHESVSRKGSNIRHKCSLYQCSRFYHPECLKLWPQTQWSLIQTTKNRFCQEEVDSFVCPQHVCHTCASDDPRAAMARCSGDKIVRCMCCPASYHSTNLCVPAGSDILTSTQIICPRHRNKTRSHTINTTWCFICNLGGNLICCETCPTSVHTECLTVNLTEDDKFICEDCESGRLPLYDEIVWVKVGQYKWWPGLIVFPNEVPWRVLNARHSPGEFVVKFFGTYDYYWVNRGRSFLFQEGDTTDTGVRVKNKVETIFKRAVEEAIVAHKMKKQFKSTQVAESASSLKPPPYIRIKVSKPVGNVKLMEMDLSNTTACECESNHSNPCGPDSNCLNRLLWIECNPEVCPAGKSCKNQSFEQREYPTLVPYKTESRGWGLKALEPIKKGQFVIEYVGELIDDEEYQRRFKKMQMQKEENYYFLTIHTNRMIDAGPKGNVARFMNHCCQPNCETQKWTVNGDTRVGLFATEDIPAHTELTFNYNLECAGTERKECKCGAPNCSGYIGGKSKQENTEPKKPKKLIKKKEPTEIIVLPPCYICERKGNVGLCNNKICNKAFHSRCLKLKEWPEGKKFVCPWHYCNMCSKRTIRCCVKCLNSYCPSHSEGNIRYDNLMGFVCNIHEPTVTKHSKRGNVSSEDAVVTSTTDDNENDIDIDSSKFSEQKSKRSKKNTSLDYEDYNSSGPTNSFKEDSESQDDTVSSATASDFEEELRPKRRKKPKRKMKVKRRKVRCVTRKEIITANNESETGSISSGTAR